MKELTIRKLHRNSGIILALFIFIQAGSGIILTLEHFSAPHSHAHEKEIVQTVKEEPQVDHTLHEHAAPENETLLPENHSTMGQKSDEAVEHDHDAGHMDNHGIPEMSFETFMKTIHHGGGILGALYHMLTGIAICIMAVTGSMIYFKIKKREKN